MFYGNLGNKYSNKYISVNIKEKVWKIHSYGGRYNYLAPCYTCEKILRVPDLIKKRLFKNLKFDKIKKFPKAVFRSVIQKLPDNFNIIPENNLILICQDCNLYFGSKNIDLDKDKADVIMISDDHVNNYCKHFILNNNRYCKNLAINNYNYCNSHIHLY